MKREMLKLAVIGMTLLAIVLVSNRLGMVQGQMKKVSGEGFAAVPGQKGGEDVFGPYDPVQNWPRPLSESLPNLKGWTYSQATYVFAETPDRVFVAQKGLLPELPKNALVRRPPASSQSLAASLPASSETWLCSIAGPAPSSSSFRAATTRG